MAPFYLKVDASYIFPLVPTDRPVLSGVNCHRVTLTVEDFLFMVCLCKAR